MGLGTAILQRKQPFLLHSYVHSLYRHTELPFFAILAVASGPDIIKLVAGRINNRKVIGEDACFEVPLL